MRGYDINAVVCFDDKSKYQNSEYLTGYFDKLGIPVYSIPWIPADLEGKDEREERALMKEYYMSVCGHREVHNVANRIIDQHKKRLENIDSMASRTYDKIWHPFQQHKHVEKPDDVLVFDSAYGDYFQVKRTARNNSNENNENPIPMLYPAFDGSASWWTQGENDPINPSHNTDYPRFGTWQSSLGS